MRGILVLYMTRVFLFSNTRAYTTFAAFTALVYLTPLFGGWIADRFIGFRRSVVLGVGVIFLFFAPILKRLIDDAPRNK